MIFLYSGTPGSGKSLHVAERIVNLNRMKIPVISTVEINTVYLKNPDIYYYLDIFDLSIEFLENFSEDYISSHPSNRYREGFMYLIIDECQMIFNSRDFMKSDRRDWLKFFSTHRHMGYNIILVSQFDKMLDKQIRCLIETECIHRSLQSWGKFGNFLKLLHIKPFLSVSCYYPLHIVTGREFFFGCKKRFRLYDSHQNFKR